MKQLVLSVLFCFSFLTLSAGAWLQGKSKGYFKLNYSLMQSSTYYNKEGVVSSTLNQSFNQASLYGEYGIANKLDIIVNVPFYAKHEMLDLDISLESLGDIDIAFKIPINYIDKFKTSVSLKFGIPSGDNLGGEDFFLQTGDGEFNQELTLDFSRSFKNNLYSNIAIGFNQRSKNYSDEIKLDLEVGIFIKQRFLLALKSRWLNSLQNGDRKETAEFSVFSNNVEYLSFGPEVAYQTKSGFGIHFSYFTATQVKNILASPQLNFGLYYDF